MRNTGVSLLLLAVLASYLPAGTVFHMQVTQSDVTPKVTTNGAIYLEGRQIRIDTDPEASLVFNGEIPRLMVLNRAEKSYLQLDEASIEEFAARVNPALEELQAEIEKMPPEQRAQMEEMMQGRGMKVPEVRYVRTGEKKSIAGYECERLDMQSDGETLREIWVTEWANLPVSANAQPVLEGMSAFFKDAFSRLHIPPGMRTQSPFEQLEQLGGFPVMTRDFDGGKVMSETLLQGIEEKQLQSDLFDAPADFERQALEIQ